MNYNFGDHNYFASNLSGTNSFQHVLDVAGIQQGSALNILELGTGMGSSACWMSDNIMDHPDSTLTCVDHFLAFNLDLAQSNIDLSKNGNKVTVLRQLIEQFIFDTTETYDLIYIDANHRTWPVLTYCFFALKHLTDQGVVIIDDYSSEFPEVQEAVEWFTKEMSESIDICDLDLDDPNIFAFKRRQIS